MNDIELEIARARAFARHVRRHTSRGCGGVSSYYGPCGADDCPACHPEHQSHCPACGCRWYAEDHEDCPACGGDGGGW